MAKPSSDPLGDIINSSSSTELKKDAGGRPIEKADGEEQHRHWMRVLESTLDVMTDSATWNGHQAWRSAYELYRGNHWSENYLDFPALQNESDRLSQAFTANYIGSHIQNLIPFLIRRDPYFLLRPTQPGDGPRMAAQAQEALLNSMWRRQRMTAQLSAAALDFAITGNGFVKTGFTVQVDRPAKGSAAKLLDYDDFYRDQYPYVRRVSPFRMLVDLTAPDQSLSTARWVGEIMFKSARDIIENDSYDPTVRKWLANPGGAPHAFTKLEEFDERYADDDGGSLLGWGDRQHGLDEITLAQDVVVLVELWDKRSGLYALYPWGVPKPLVERDWPGGAYLRTFPYHHAKFIPIPDEMFAIGHPAITRDQQHLLNRLRTRQSLYLRSFNTQRQGPPLSADDQEKIKRQNPDDYIQLPGGDPREISYINPPQLPQDLYRVYEDVKADLRELSGNDALIAGGQLPARTSATEVNARERIFGLKLDHQVGQIDRLFEEVGTQVLAHLQGNPSSSDVRAFDRNGRPIVVRPEDLKHEVDVEVISTSRPKDDPEIRQQTGLQLLQALATTMPALLQIQGIQQQAGLKVMPLNVDFNPILRYVVDAFESKELDDALPPEPAGVPPEAAAAVGTAYNPPGGPNPDDEAAAFRSGRSLVSDFANPSGV